MSQKIFEGKANRKEQILAAAEALLRHRGIGGATLAPFEDGACVPEGG